MGDSLGVAEPGWLDENVGDAVDGAGCPAGDEVAVGVGAAEQPPRIRAATRVAAIRGDLRIGPSGWRVIAGRSVGSHSRPWRNSSRSERPGSGRS
jgi:hypothetical protein